LYYLLVRGKKESEMKENLVSKILKQIAPRIGARVILEPTWGKVGQIIFKSGQKRYFRYSTLDLNRMGASDIARDKDYTKFFMKRMGYPVIPGEAFCSENWAATIGSRKGMAAAYRYAKALDWPVIVKPNSSSQGRCVAKVHTRREFEAAFRAVSRIDKMVLIEKYIEGRDYRIVVLDDEVISAYERIPLSVCGDGKTSIRELLARKQRWFKRTGRDTIIKTDDPRITAKLLRLGLSFRSRPDRGSRIFLLDNANLSGGGDSVDVTAQISEGFKRLAVQLTKDMGLRLCGVDLITQRDISEPPAQDCHWVIEINSAPGLDHYASIGKEQTQVVEKLYLKVLKAMDTDA
jgi:D-alanine-D-alanine ligase-like ATP-grasp enzyme